MLRHRQGKQWTDNAVPVKDVQVWREGDWIRVKLDGVLVWQRLFRAPVLRVYVCFAPNRSPSYPKALLNFTECQIIPVKFNKQALYRENGHARRNSICVEISEIPCD